MFSVPTPFSRSRQLNKEGQVFAGVMPEVSVARPEVPNYSQGRGTQTPRRI